MGTTAVVAEIPDRRGLLGTARALELVVLALALVGLVMSYSASAPYSADARTGDLADTWRTLIVHSVKLGVGIALFVAVRRVPLSWVERHHRRLMIGALALLVIVLIPGIGAKLNGARRWFSFGPLAFQPVELAKIVVVAAVAAELRAMGDGVTRLAPCARLLLTFVAPVCVLLCCQPDFGSTVLLAGIVFLLMIFAGARPAHYIPATLFGFGGLVAAAWLFLPHVLERFSRHVDPKPGEQAYQSLVALGSGGLAGMDHGIGAGMAKLGYLPMISSDFVFASVGEELGFLGTTLVVFLFVMFTLLASRVVLAQRDMFRFLLGAGITLSISVQVLINLVVVTAVTPTKGIALPFISAGGSSLVMSLVAVGILVSLAKDAASTADDAAEARTPAARAVDGSEHLVECTDG